jgi:hypothetical protein
MRDGQTRPTTNVNTFLHNNLEMLEQVLKNAQDKYYTKMAIIDGNIDISELVGLWEFNFFHSEFPTKISCISKYMLRYRRKI